jgi:hypothetical protein
VFEDKVLLGGAEGVLGLSLRLSLPSGVEIAPDPPGPGRDLRLPVVGVGPELGTPVGAQALGRPPAAGGFVEHLEDVDLVLVEAPVGQEDPAVIVLDQDEEEVPEEREVNLSPGCRTATGR